MIAALVDTLDWVEELREDMRDNLVRATAFDRRGCRGPAPIFDWAACGKPAQYRKHLRHGIPVCEPCRQAEARRSQDKKRSAQTDWLTEFNRMIEKVNADLRSRA